MTSACLAVTVTTALPTAPGRKGSPRRAPPLGQRLLSGGRGRASSRPPACHFLVRRCSTYHVLSAPCLVRLALSRRPFPPPPKTCRQGALAAMNNTVLHVFAACSSEYASGWRRTRLDNLKRTMRIWALPFACVGSRDHWRGFGEMAAQYAAAAEGVPAHHHVVMLDSADAFAQGSTGEVLAAFRRVSSGRPIVLGLETGCPRCRSMVNSSSWPPTAQHAVALAHGSPLDPSVELGPPAMQPMEPLRGAIRTPARCVGYPGTAARWCRPPAGGSSDGRGRQGFHGSRTSTVAL